MEMGFQFADLSIDNHIQEQMNQIHEASCCDHSMAASTYNMMIATLNS